MQGCKLPGRECAMARLIHRWSCWRWSGGWGIGCLDFGRKTKELSPETNLSSRCEPSFTHCTGHCWFAAFAPGVALWWSWWPSTPTELVTTCGFTARERIECKCKCVKTVSEVLYLNLKTQLTSVPLIWVHDTKLLNFYWSTSTGVLSVMMRNYRASKAQTCCYFHPAHSVKIYTQTNSLLNDQCNFEQITQTCNSFNMS